jgi:hypothetical protein
VTIELTSTPNGTYDVVINRCCIGYIATDRTLGFRARPKILQYGELDRFEMTKFDTKESAQNALIADFKARIKGTDATPTSAISTPAC